MLPTAKAVILPGLEIVMSVNAITDMFAWSELLTARSALADVRRAGSMISPSALLAQDR